MKRRNFIIALLLTLLLCSESLGAFRELEFGRYHSDSRSLSPIVWLVLDENEDSQLLITRDCIDQLPYNERRANVTWENCTLRTWLNGEFLSTAFTPEEQARILPSSGVFVLSREEVLQFMPDEASRQTSPTPYARNRGVYSNARGLCAWWTRTLERDRSQAVYLSSYGSFGRGGHYVDDDVIGVRPAVWVRPNTHYFP